MTAYKEVVELAGYTQRVHTMLEVFQDCAESRFSTEANFKNSSSSSTEDRLDETSSQTIVWAERNISYDKTPYFLLTLSL